MTYSEKYGTYINFQNELARKALEFNRGELRTLEVAVNFGNDYAVRTNMPHNEVVDRYERLKDTIKRLEKMLKSDGRIIDPLYRAYWISIKDKEYEG
jgi:hypothetical protein